MYSNCTVAMKVNLQNKMNNNSSQKYIKKLIPNVFRRLIKNKNGLNTTKLSSCKFLHACNVLIKTKKS